jgi:hypothetical protein
MPAFVDRERNDAMRARFAISSGVVLVAGTVVVVLGFGALGYFFLTNVVLGRTGILAYYDGMNLSAERDGWSWSYNVIEVTSPADADLSVQLGGQPPVAVKDLTPAMIAQYLRERGRKLPVDPDRANVLPGGEIHFEHGVAKYALFQWRSNLSFARSGHKFTLPVSQREVDAVFGKPKFTQPISHFN